MNLVFDPTLYGLATHFSPLHANTAYIALGKEFREVIVDIRLVGKDWIEIVIVV